jgi:hypothetical protein
VAKPAETQTEVDFVLLCDHAEVVNGKLYMMGGAWNRIARLVPLIPGTSAGQLEPLPSAPGRFAIATSVLVDWNEANDSLPIELSIEDPDGRTRLWEAQGSLTAGRPAGAMKGVPVRTVFAQPLLIGFPRAGEYSVRVRLTDRASDHLSDRTERFEVVDQPVFAAPAEQ